ncbi:acid phosphatase AphA [Xenorhabdus griffiniae]|uniref:Class B acid phosphatase n=1 Tax=Xenorhabdus griffiniae TaxID=351672 RepID=A0ABY9XGG3_9GAMM|nr:acid phosphatase AphA [Xenorhabdus griffiniae]MBD1227860.1 acid phosphatase AphA [Xenorhabdus griffiniae]MBE8589279.1 acid phosphatase AphA [Xenorhabdus griffiniae]WMV72015.1 acid phosphatase AphA [Xenorhabdus griffiniae]WNH01693.1 acid phosphatase AphA [Xenorhabdus griffiniae]
MNKLTAALTSIILILGFNDVLQAKVFTLDQVESGVNSTDLPLCHTVHWVSVRQIEKSLEGKPPIAVGFDIDDTVIFSSPGFYRGKIEYSPNDESYLKNQQFWEKMNNEWNKFSMPKKIGIELIKMHKKRGDDIYFITGRTETKIESITKQIQKMMHISDSKMHSVIFAGDDKNKNDKASWIKKYKLEIYYGDADEDIIAAHESNIRGIRILRASNSSYQPLPKAGKFGEEVIIKSDY